MVSDLGVLVRNGSGLYKSHAIIAALFTDASPWNIVTETLAKKQIPFYAEVSLLKQNSKLYGILKTKNNLWFDFWIFIKQFYVALSIVAESQVFYHPVAWCLLCHLLPYSAMSKCKLIWGHVAADRFIWNYRNRFSFADNQVTAFC